MKNPFEHEQNRLEKLLPYVVLGGLGFAVYQIHTAEESVEQTKSITPKQALRSTDPCSTDMFRFVSGEDRYVVTDARCRNGKEGQVDIMSSPNEATLGPVASASGALVLRASCVEQGQKVTSRDGTESDEWVKVTFEGSYEGYVNSLDVIAETGLTSCNTVLA